MALQVAWALAMAASLTASGLPPVATAALEALRPAAWSVFLLAVLATRLRHPLIVAGVVAASALALAHLASVALDAPDSQRFAIALLAAVGLLLCTEQVYRNATEAGRWAIKFLCLAIAATALLDLTVYSDALLFGRVDAEWWAARGYAHALVAPLVAVSAARVRDWRLEIRVSREVVFHGATLLVSGAFLLAIAAVGYGLGLFGEHWADVASATLLFAGALAVAALAGSGRLRARLRVLVAKHFFTYRYDYRTEWLRLTDLLATSDEARTHGDGLSARALDGLCALVGSPGGAIWLKDEGGRWVCDARRGRDREHPALDDDDRLVRFAATRDWIVDVGEWRAAPERHDGLAIPDWLDAEPDAWLVVPLRLHGQAIGLALLERPADPIALDWEVRDVLTAAGRQVAGYLAVRQAVERLVQARQFESFNRMSAFVVHDLKNLVAQLSLLLGNATRHRDNPEFRRDMLETVENVLDRMQGLLLQLRAGTRPIEPPAPVRLADVLRAAIRAKQGSRLEPSLEIDDDVRDVEVVAHRDRLERVVGHLVQNALEATPPGGSVRVRARLDDGTAAIEVVDTGAGMSREFVETRLFRPFTSTKAHGMGIGAFESREYVREIGGSLHVRSTEGAGSTFSIRLPVAVASAARAVEEAV